MNIETSLKRKQKYQYSRNVLREQLRKRTSVNESKQGRRRSVGQCSLVIKCVLVFGFHSLLWMSHIPYFLNFFHTYPMCLDPRFSPSISLLWEEEVPVEL